MVWLRNGAHCKTGIGLRELLGSALSSKRAAVPTEIEGFKLINKPTSCVN